MNREARRLIVSTVTVLTFAALFFLTYPIVTRWGSAKVQAVAKAGGPRVVSNLMWQGVMPQIAAVMGCLLIALVVGFVVGSKLPRPKSSAR